MDGHGVETAMLKRWPEDSGHTAFGAAAAGVQGSPYASAFATLETTGQLVAVRPTSNTAEDESPAR